MPGIKKLKVTMAVQKQLETKGATGGRAESEEKLVDFSKIGPIVKKNWTILGRDKARFVPMLMFPLIMILIYGSTAGTTAKHVPALIVDYDGSSYSQQLVQEIYADETFTVRAQLASQEQARRMLDSGQAKIFFVIPPGIGKEVEEGGNPKIAVFLDRSDGTTAGIASGQARAVAERISAKFSAQRLVALQASLQKSSALLAQANALQQALASPAPLSYAQEKADSAYGQSQAISSGASKVLSAQINDNQNSLGNLIDPNELVGAFQPNSVYSQGVSVLFKIADTQQQTLKNIAFYKTLKGEFGLEGKASSDAYAGLLEARSKQLASGGEAKVTVGLVEQAANETTHAVLQAQKIPAQVSVSFVEPYGEGRRGLDFLLPNILALVIFQGAAAGLGRAIAGERQNGSMTRVFLTPTSSTTIIVGTQVFYLAVEALRSTLIVAVAVLFFGVAMKGSVLDVLALIALYAVGATGIGMILSVMAKTQEQYMSMSIVVILPTVFLSGVFFPIQSLPGLLQSLASMLPMAPMASATSAVMVKGLGLAAVLPQVAYLAAFGLFTVIVSIMLFQRELV